MCPAEVWNRAKRGLPITWACPCSPVWRRSVRDPLSGVQGGASIRAVRLGGWVCRTVAHRASPSTQGSSTPTLPWRVHPIPMLAQLPTDAGAAHFPSRDNLPPFPNLGRSRFIRSGPASQEDGCHGRRRKVWVDGLGALIPELWERGSLDMYPRVRDDAATTAIGDVADLPPPVGDSEDAVRNRIVPRHPCRGCHTGGRDDAEFAKRSDGKSAPERCRPCAGSPATPLPRHPQHPGKHFERLAGSRIDLDVGEPVALRGAAVDNHHG